MAEFCTIIVLVLGMWLMAVMVKNRMPQSSTAGAEARSHATHQEWGSVLIVKERHISLQEAIEIEASRDVLVNYTPDRYVYQSVSYGGVTTGGVTKLQGGYSMQTGAKTGTYFLSFKYAKFNEFGSYRWSSKYFSNVSVPERDYKLAQKDPVLKKYMADPKQQKYLGDGLNMSAVEAKTAFCFVGMSKEEAEHIRDWLAGVIS